MNRDEKFVGNTNYEEVMKFLEDRRAEKQGSQMTGQEEQVNLYSFQDRKISDRVDKRRSVGRSKYR